MLTKITLSLPSQFDYQRTIHLIQRGQDDPINRISHDKFTRCYPINGQAALIQASINELKDLDITLLKGTATRLEIKNAVYYMLGLDDPLLQNTELKIPYKAKLLTHWGITAPGYPCYFEALVQIIFGQQVSVAVANRLRTRFSRTFGAQITYQGEIYHAFPTPEAILSQSLNTLRALGMSETKSKTISLLAREFVEANLMQDIKSATSVDVIRERLEAQYGIGRWTVDWFLLRALRRFEVIAGTDLAVRKAFTWWADKQELLSAEAVDAYAKRLKPYGGALTYRILSAYLTSLKRASNID